MQYTPGDKDLHVTDQIATNRSKTDFPGDATLSHSVLLLFIILLMEVHPCAENMSSTHGEILKPVAVNS